MSTTTTTILKRHESTELSFIDINSSATGSKLWTHCFERGREWATKTFSKHHSLDFLGDRKYSVSRSWCLSQSVFIAARQWVLKYMLTVFLLLGLRDAFEDCPLGLYMYCMEVLATLMAALTGRIFVHEIQKECRERSGYLTPVRKVRSRTKWRHLCNGFTWIFRKTFALPLPFDWNNLVLWITTLLIQNCCALVAFWDIVFWTGMLRIHNIRLVDFVKGTNVILLNICNTVPVLFELLFGATVFRPTLFVPSFLFISTLLWVRFPPAVIVSNDFDVSTFSDLLGVLQGKNFHIIRTAVLVRLLVVYIAVCATLCWIQYWKYSVTSQKLS